jgi:hypothetical protein
MQPPPPYTPYYPPYAYYPPYYPYAYSPPPAPKPLEPRQLRTVQGFDTAVFASYVLGASFVWGALVGGIAIAAMMPTLGGTPQLGPTELGWFNGIAVARWIVWVMFGVAGILVLAALARFHEGRLEFGPKHERRWRELQASTALFLVVVGGAGVLTFLLSNQPLPPASPLAQQDLVNQVKTLRDSVRLSALIWALSSAGAGLLLSKAFVNFLRDFLPAQDLRALRIFPVVFVFVPLLHGALSISFLELAALDTGTWTVSAVRAVVEAGGLAGIASAVPLVLLVRALRAAQDRVLSGEVPSVLIKKPA